MEALQWCLGAGNSRYYINKSPTPASHLILVLRSHLKLMLIQLQRNFYLRSSRIGVAELSVRRHSRHYSAFYNGRNARLSHYTHTGAHWHTDNTHTRQCFWLSPNFNEVGDVKTKEEQIGHNKSAFNYSSQQWKSQWISVHPVFRVRPATANRTVNC